MTSTITEERTSTSPEPAAARPVFSREDASLIKTAVAHYLQQPEVQDSPDSVKYANLYHRLGRMR